MFHLNDTYLSHAAHLLLLRKAFIKNILFSYPSKEVYDTSSTIIIKWSSHPIDLQRMFFQMPAKETPTMRKETSPRNNLITPRYVYHALMQIKHLQCPFKVTKAQILHMLCSMYKYGGRKKGIRCCLHLGTSFYSQYMNPSITATSPTLMPAISLPPLAPPFFVLDAEGELVVAVPVAAAPALLAERVCPTLGSLTSPSTNQPPAVELGHAGGVKVGE
jgi:hypothetical protein